VNQPQGIVETAVYTREQVCAVLGIGDTKLRDLVKQGALHPLAFTAHWRFFGRGLIRLCEEAAGVTGAAPVGIIETAVYDSEQTRAALQIGESKLKQLVAAGELNPLTFTSRHRFWGQDLIRLCRLASEGSR